MMGRSLKAYISLSLSLSFLQATENVGMVMVFTLVSAVQEKLTEKREEAKARRKKEREEQEEAARKAAEVRFVGC